MPAVNICNKTPSSKSQIPKCCNGSEKKKGKHVEPLHILPFNFTSTEGPSGIYQYPNFRPYSSICDQHFTGGFVSTQTHF